MSRDDLRAAFVAAEKRAAEKQEAERKKCGDEGHLMRMVDRTGAGAPYYRCLRCREKLPGTPSRRTPPPGELTCYSIVRPVTLSPGDLALASLVK